MLFQIKLNNESKQKQETANSNLEKLIPRVKNDPNNVAPNDITTTVSSVSIHKAKKLISNNKNN